MKKTPIQILSISAMLTALGMAIPMFMPVRFVMEPASFTLASHVPIILAMLLSPGIAAAVAIGTTAGFIISSTPIIALRAATHLIFALIGAYYLQHHPAIRSSLKKTHFFSLLIGFLHAACEMGAVSIFYLNGSLASSFYQQGYLRSIVLLLGVGTVIHSLVDFEIALVVYQALSQNGFTKIGTRRR